MSAGANSFVLSGVGPFDLVDDEVIADLDLNPDLVPLVCAQATGHPDSMRRAAWGNTCGKGRIVCDLPGQDYRSIKTTSHGNRLESAVRWLVGGH